MDDSLLIKRAIESATAILENAGLVVIRKQYNKGFQLIITSKTLNNSETEEPFSYPEHVDNTYSIIE